MVFTSWLCLHRNTGLVGTMVSVYDGTFMQGALAMGQGCPPWALRLHFFVCHLVSAALHASR